MKEEEEGLKKYTSVTEAAAELSAGTYTGTVVFAEETVDRQTQAQKTDKDSDKTQSTM